MRIATYNVNGVNGRLPVLLRWLQETQPDVVCLQELKAPEEKFPEQAINDAGYKAIWHGQKSWNGVAILSRYGDIKESRRGLPGDPEDLHSRYIEAVINGIVIGCLYLPNGNPAPGPKFDYKLAWFQRLTAHAAQLLSYGTPVVLCGDYNVMPADIDVYKPERWVDDALFRPETRAAFHALIAQGWTDAIRKLYPTEKIYTFYAFPCMGRYQWCPVEQYQQPVLRFPGYAGCASRQRSEKPIDYQKRSGWWLFCDMGRLPKCQWQQRHLRPEIQ